jgi:Ca2+-binding RTX toxin-like protein
VKFDFNVSTQNVMNAWIGKQDTIPTIASKKLSVGDQALANSGNDLLLLDFSEAEFGNKLTLQNEKVVAVKGNAGLVVDASGDTAGIELVIDNNAKKVLTGSGNDKITGSQASDVIAAGTGTNNVDGGDGLDVLVFNGSKKDFTMTEGQVSKTDETTAYSNVEFLRFDDGLVTVSGNDWADNLIQDTWVLI